MALAIGRVFAQRFRRSQHCENSGYGTCYAGGLLKVIPDGTCYAGIFTRENVDRKNSRMVFAIRELSRSVTAKIVTPVTLVMHIFMHT